MKAKSKIGMGFKKAAASIAKKDTVNLAKALTSPKALAAQKIAAAVRPRPMGLKVDSTKKVMPVGGSKPSVVIKKQTTVKPKDMVDISKSKNLPKWMKKPIPGVDRNAFPKKAK